MSKEHSNAYFFNVWQSETATFPKTKFCAPFFTHVHIQVAEMSRFRATSKPELELTSDGFVLHVLSHNAFALNFHIYSSIAWWDSGSSAAWKWFCRWSDNIFIFQAWYYSMLSFEGSFWRLPVKWIIFGVSINQVLLIVFFNQWISKNFINLPINLCWRKFVDSHQYIDAQICNKPSFWYLKFSTNLRSISFRFSFLALTATLTFIK